MTSGRLKRSDELFVKFIETLEKQDGNVSLTCKMLGISKTAAYAWKNSDAAFSQAWDEAIEFTLELLEQEAYRRGVKGYLRPVYYKGVEVGQVKEYSDRLLEFLLNHRYDVKARIENLPCGITGTSAAQPDFCLENLTPEEIVTLSMLLEKAQIRLDSPT